MDQEREIQKVSAPLTPPPPSPDGDGQVYCPVCGRDGDPGLKRFGQLFCSQAHVAQYASERRGQGSLVEAAPTAVEGENKPSGGQPMACGIGTKGGLRKMGWCLAGGVGLLIAIPLIASGGLAATAGSLLTVVAFLACPIGMYLMMRAMMKGQHSEPPDNKGKER